MQQSKMDYNFHPPPCSEGRCRDLTNDFIFIVLVPVVLVLVVAVILAVLLLRKKSERVECSEENGVQLARYNSIRRASQNIRELSNHRDSMLSTSRSGSMSFMETERPQRGIRPSRNSAYSAPSTLQRERRQTSSDERMTFPPTYTELFSTSVHPPRENQTDRSSLQVPVVYYQPNIEERVLIQTP
ncbi:uncharacterized protein LOC125658713 [Ostrea edulis]|uniref:uncharacterized protein LOC125658713 n=1 Tax=Ostrea edulis TaxID=37623 RepID=UPI0024AFD582|nr:uncharacterized protein LOC125658713 [Ostrea edulis]